ncbi:hypothetical protein G4B88_016201 [Cannabis sativa]|uniref:Protein FAR1-RELATED SEQUENCE n=1 Tax=Cannabis sativa TaxID=3483 RepID=A0A7J6EYH5_CANSA|nr:hypothetical protein G4B88_016201 [Cannabis sativa]
MKIKFHPLGKYQVIEFNAEHTHITASPSKSHLDRSQRRITPAQASEIELVESSGIAPKASMELMMRRVATVYTPAVLRMFEADFSKAYNCAMEICTAVGTMTDYKLTPNGKYFHHMVKYGSSVNTSICSCKNFEASDSKKAYKLAKEVFKGLSDDIDACLKEERVESKEENHIVGGIDTTIKGVKTNNKKIRGGSSRSKNALEKMLSHDFNTDDQIDNYMPLSQPDLSFSTTSFNLNHVGLTHENSSMRTSMTDLFSQVDQSTSTEFGGTQFFKNTI